MKHNKLYLAIITIIILAEAITTGLLPLSRGHLFDLLSTKVGPIWVALLLYFLNYLAIDFCQSIKGYWVLKIALWYRELRTRFIKTSLACQLGTNWRSRESLPTNTPQRIQEDIKLSYTQRISVWVEYVISGLILIQLVALNFHEPLLIAFALSYAALSVYIAIKFNPRLTKAEIDVQQAEANYRTGLVANILDISGMSIANKACTSSKWIQTEYLLFTKLQLGLVAVLPYVILLPQLLSGIMELGTLIKHQSSFGLIVVNASVIIQLYTTYIQGKASEERVKEI